MVSTNIKKLKSYVEECHSCFVDGNRSGTFIRKDDMDALERKRKLLRKRNAEIVKNIVDGYVIREHSYGSRTIVDYVLAIQQVISQQEKLYMEEQMQKRRAVMEDGEIIDDYLLAQDGDAATRKAELPKTNNDFSKRGQAEKRYSYNRLEVVKYAERWWNDYNPEYRQFENDCTNFVSQCIHAGGAPMTGYPDRSNGWWYQSGQWSYTWTVAHALRWYLNGANQGLKAEEVSSPDQLLRGDVICYDFNGDGNWQHTTIVVAKERDGMPLVNAHTTNSRMRYWSYEDSTAWTEKIKYKFFHILD